MNTAMNDRIALSRMGLVSDYQGTPVIELAGVEKIYLAGSVPVHALRHIDLEIYRGEFIAIMGASGSGKSTLMNILGCLDRPTRGSYFLEGVDVSGLDKDQRAGIRNGKIGFVFQGFNLLRRTSALENVELPLIYSGVPAAERAPAAVSRSVLLGWPTGKRAIPTSFPEASSSAWPSRGRWSTIRRCCLPTSPRETSIRGPLSRLWEFFRR